MKKYLFPSIFIAALAGIFAAIAVLMEWTLLEVATTMATGAGFTALSFWLYRRMEDDDL
jgi:hypothetical protein